MTTTLDRSSNGIAPTESLAVAAVPEKSFYDSYVSRDVGGVWDLDMLAYAHSTATNVLIQGPTASGKTSAVLAYSAYKQQLFYSVSSSTGLEPTQLFGKYAPDGFGGWVWQDGPVTSIVRNGGVLLLNEVNFIPPRVGTVLFSLLDKRRVIQLLDHGGEVVRAHHNDCWCDLPPAECEKRWLLVVADMNPGYKGTTPLNQAFKNRFGIQQHWGYDKKIEKKLLPYAELHKLSDLIRSAESISTDLGVNMLQDFVAHAQNQKLGWQFAVNNFVSRFAEDEQAEVSQLMDLHRQNLRLQILKLAAKKVVKDDLVWDADDYDLKVVGTKDNPNPINWPDYRPEMGIYNINWDLAEDDGGDA